jgi:aarF domain-containing kinase
MTRRARGVAAAVALATLGAAATVEEDEGDAATLARGTARAAYAAATVATMVVDYKLAKRETWRSEGGAHDRNAKRLHAMCGANGGLYVKAGQFASTAGGVPEAYARRLSKLQDEVAPSPRDAVLKVVRNEFGGRAPEALFETFEPEPMAAASLAHVHRAVLKSGRTVAVKIQRPGLERSIESDISTMSALVRFTRLFFPSFDFGFMVDEFKSRLEKEIDFEAEGRNCERLGLAFADDARIDTPEVFWDLTTRRVLTMEFIDGEKLTNIEGMREKGLDPEHAALALSDCFARMLLVHGYIHGDPHPGNLLCRAHPDGSGRTQVVLLDHGLYSELTEESRKAMSNLWIAIAVGDSVRAVAAAKALQVPDEFAWLMPLALARKTSSGEPVDRRVLEKQWADDKAKGGAGRPGLGEAAIIGNNLSKEMIIVLRANALVRNVIKALGDSRESSIAALEMKRQWCNVRYAALGLIVPRALGASSISRGVSTRRKLLWRARSFGIFARVSRRAFARVFARRRSAPP